MELKPIIRSRSQGVTLVEMMVVVTIIGLMAAVSFPSVASGLDSIRLQSAAEGTAAFVNAAVNRTERRQQVSELVINPSANHIELYSTEPGYQRTFPMPPNVTLGGPPRRILLLAGGAAPRFSIDLTNRRGAHKRVTMDPISGMSQVTVVQAAQ